MVSVSGDCNPADVRVGLIRRMFSGLNSVWVKCPLAAAIKVATEGRVRMGWTSARVRLLEARPVQCFKCWRFGHVRNICKYSEDRKLAIVSDADPTSILLETAGLLPNAPFVRSLDEELITAWDLSPCAMSRGRLILLEYRSIRLNNVWSHNGDFYSGQSE